MILYLNFHYINGRIKKWLDGLQCGLGVYGANNAQTKNINVAFGFVTNVTMKTTKIKRDAMSEIEKRKSEIQTALDLDIKPGDMVLQIGGHSEGDVYKVGKIETETVELLREYEYEDSDDEPEWGHYGDIEIERFIKNYTKMHKTYEELEAETLAKLGDISALEQDDTVSNETALATNDKQMMVACEKSLMAKETEIKTMMAILENKKNELWQIAHGLEKQLKKVRKVIAIVELYLGIKEEIIQIQEGNNADANEPISIRQMLLYMDEEVGTTENQGIDYTKIETFDNWLLDGGIETVLPEKKGIVALQICRKEKHYSRNAIVNFNENMKNKTTYILIRNGDNVYRIWSTLHIYKRMFPTLKEFSMEKIKDMDEEKVEDNILEYKKHFLLMQGLIDRTQIFAPLKSQLNIFQEDTWNGQLRFIRDDELQLPTGRLLFKEWRNKINSEIKVGSRILYIDGYCYSGGMKDWMGDHVSYQHRNSQRPSDGIYQVVPGNDWHGKENLRFIYNPGGTIYTGDAYYGYDSHERKRGIGFRYYDDEVLNYDAIDLDDVEFYLESRVDRHNYLDMLPVLRNIKKMRLEEIEYEKQLVKLIVGEGFSENNIWTAIEWWKLKNKWKRPIDKDDAKALRMIRKKLAKGM